MPKTDDQETEPVFGPAVSVTNTFRREARKGSNGPIFAGKCLVAEFFSATLPCENKSRFSTWNIGRVVHWKFISLSFSDHFHVALASLPPMSQEVPFSVVNHRCRISFCVLLVERMLHAIYVSILLCGFHFHFRFILWSFPCQSFVSHLLARCYLFTLASAWNFLALCNWRQMDCTAQSRSFFLFPSSILRRTKNKTHNCLKSVLAVCQRRV